MELVLQKQVEVKIENRIAEFRKEKGLSQHSLAKAVGLKRRSIMAYENKTISPTLETAYKICKVLDKDIKQVFIFD
ncbi:helix-turn-helix domain-containing protein [Anaerococcus sp. mt242]|nr:helix-turn-helix domain-containing protein [Anaerococcus sp. mt242]